VLKLELCISKLKAFGTDEGFRFVLFLDLLAPRNIEGVRTYKRISEQQVKDVSTLLNDATNGAPAVKKCKFTQQTEQKTTITNSYVP